MRFKAWNHSSCLVPDPLNNAEEVKGVTASFFTAPDIFAAEEMKTLVLIVSLRSPLLGLSQRGATLKRAGFVITIKIGNLSKFLENLKYVK